MKHPIAEVIDGRLAQSLVRIESKVDYRPVKVAAWGVAAASVLGAVAAGFGAVAAVAGAYVAVRSAIRISRTNSASATNDVPRVLPVVSRSSDNSPPES